MKIVMPLVGNGTIDNPNSTIEKIVQDLKRVKYMTEYFDAMLRAMRYISPRLQSSNIYIYIYVCVTKFGVLSHF